MSDSVPTNFNQLSLTEKIGQLFFIGISGAALDADTRELLQNVKPGGICLFGRNIKEPRQTRKLLDDLYHTLPVIPFLSLDQEGGLVDRLRRIMTPAPAAAKFKNNDDVAEFAEIVADSLRQLGFNMDFAPVVDVITGEREVAGNGMYSRGYGRSCKEVVELAGTFLETMQQKEIICCLKHFPGLGAARSDSHEELPKIDISDDELRATDLYPYRKLLARSVEMVMIAHAAYPNSRLQQEDQNGRLLPSSLSVNFASKLLRDELGFRGIAITDDLEMGAIVNNYGIGDACKLALAAGNDILAICAKPEAIKEGWNAILAAVESGEIGTERIDKSLKRILSLKRKLKTPPTFDKDRLNRLTDRLEQLNSRLS